MKRTKHAMRRGRSVHLLTRHRVGRGMATGGAYALLAGACVVTMLALAFASSRSPITSASGGPGGTPTAQTPFPDISKSQHTCGFPGLPACPESQIQWIPLASQAPGDVMAAARTSRLFGINADGRGDTPSLANLGTPQLVRALAPAGAPAVPDYFDLPILDANGTIIGVVLCELNRSHSAIAVIAIIQYGRPRSSGALAEVSLQQAVSDVAAQHAVALRSGVQPQLVYFPFDFNAQETGKLNWVAGGESPDNPVWDIPGADGKDHFVGSDGHVYYLNDLPIMAAASS